MFRININPLNLIFYIKLIFIFILFITKFGLAEQQKKISIIGNKNIDKEVIYSIIENKLTDYSVNNLNEIIKILYETGNFKNIEAEFLKDEIILNIKENPTIGKINFNGNKRFKKNDILEIFNRDEYLLISCQFSLTLLVAVSCEQSLIMK